MDTFLRFLNAFLMIALPLGLGVLLARRFKVEWRLFGIGALIFVASQVLHIPFNAWVLNPLMQQWGIFGAQEGYRLVLFALLLGVSAGVFEEVARYLFFRFWLKEDRDWESALMLGAGHGGVEAILLGILALYALIQALALRNADLSGLLPADQIEMAQMQLETYWSLPWPMALMGAVERIGALCFHLSATVLVLQVFVRRNWLWLLAAIGWHTLLDAVAVFAVQTWGVYVTEGLILLLGALGVGIVFWLRDSHPEPEEGSTPPQPPASESRSSPPSAEHLDDSRFV